MKCLLSKFHTYLFLSSSIVLMGLATSPHVFQQDSTETTKKLLINGNLNNAGTKLLLSDVGSDGDITLDFLSSVPNIYISSNISSNRMRPALDFGATEIRRDIFDNLGSQIVETGSTNIVSNDFDLAILEIDTIFVDSAEAFILFLPSASSLVTEPNQFDITATAQGATLLSTFSDNSDYLTDVSNLSSPQENLGISLGGSSNDRDFDSHISVVGNGNSSIKGALQSELKVKR